MKGTGGLPGETTKARQIGENPSAEGWSGNCSTRGSKEGIMQTGDVQKDSAAWLFEVWASFAMSVGVTGIGIVYLPVSDWIRAFLGMGLLFSVGSSLSLAKTLRDQHEAARLLSKLTEAKNEKILRELELGETTDRPVRAA
jgi:hypothetical protein